MTGQSVGEWNQWQSWSPCSRSCGNGRQQRTRTCRTTYPACQGETVKGKHCHERECPMVKCTGQISVGRGAVSDGEISYGTIRSFTCDRGYELRGEKTTRCQGNGEWTIPSTTCTIMNCGRPQVKVKSSVLAQTTTFGSTAEYTCDRGHKMTGSRTAQCDSTCLRLEGNGRCSQWSVQWSSPPPQCTAVKCLRLVPVAHGWMHPPVQFGTFSYPERRSFGCSRGYYTHPGGFIANRQCREDRTWSGGRPMCRPVDCLTPPVREHLMADISQGSIFGKRAEYSCKLGYTLKGQRFTTCTPNCTFDRIRQQHVCLPRGHWSGQTPECEPAKCPALPPFNHGTQTGRSRQIGAVVRYSCNTNYQLVGPAERRCLPSTAWSGENTRCEFSCPPGRCVGIPSEESTCNARFNRPSAVCHATVKPKLHFAALLKIKGARPNCTQNPDFYHLTVRVKKLFFTGTNCAWLRAQENRQLDVPLQNGCPCPFPQVGVTYIVTGDCQQVGRLNLGYFSLLRRRNSRVERNLLNRCRWNAISG